MPKERSIQTLTLDGGALPFHLVNTVYAWRGENLHEYLTDYFHVLEWCAKVELLNGKEVRLLRNEAAARPAAAAAAYKQIIDVRLLLYQFFSAVASGKQTEITPFLTPYNDRIQEAFTHFAWSRAERGLQFEYITTGPDLLQPLWLVLKSAHDLLLQADPARIKECPLCGWIFLDSTKNNKRRWCSPETCGSIEKSKKYYRKKVNGMGG